MRFKADEIVSVLQSEIPATRRLDIREVGRVLEVGDGIARVYGLSNAMAGELVEFTAPAFADWSSTSKKTPSASSSSAIISRSRKAMKSAPSGTLLEVPGRRRRHRPRRRSARRSAGRQGADRLDQNPAARIHRPGHRRPPAGQSAAADRHQGHRRHDPDRPRPARADHRRPQDRQDRHRHRHDHQSEATKTSSASTSPSARRNRRSPASWKTLRAQRGDGLHDRRGRRRRRRRPAAVFAPYAGTRDGRILHVRAGPRYSVRLRRLVQAGRRLSPVCRCSFAVLRAARRIPATSSFAIRACSSGRRSWPNAG